MIDEVVNHPGQISEQVNIKITGLEEQLNQGSFDRIGGNGTLREIQPRLKRLQKVSGVKQKLEDRDWEQYGPLGPVGGEEWRGPGCSNWRNSSFNNHSSLTETPPSNLSSQLPSLTESEGSTESDGVQRESSGGSIVSLLRQSFQQTGVGSAQLVSRYVDDQVFSLRPSNNGLMDTRNDLDTSNEALAMDDDSDLLNEE